MLRLSTILAGVILTASSCSSSGPVPAPTAANASATQTANEFTGRWTGKTPRGGSIVLNVPSAGTPTYVFRGENVRVSSSRVSNGTMVLIVGTGNARITLTPQGDGSLAFDYRFQGDGTSAVLRKS